MVNKASCVKPNAHRRRDETVASRRRRQCVLGFKPIITIAIRLRYDYHENLACLFFARVESRRMKAGARDTS